MKIIPLTKGYSTVVDDGDFDWLSQWKWTAGVIGKKKKAVYAYRTQKKDGTQTRIYLHRSIMDAPKGFDIDHINHNTLDNQRSNLRLATRCQNLANNHRPRGRSGFKGVSANAIGRFVARCGRNNHVGIYATAEEAARAYDAAALEKFGKFAQLNFPELRSNEQRAEPLA